jgi:hypothetical protein
MSWAGGVVLLLLFLSAIASKLLKSYPRDLIFAIASLLTPLFGIVPSGQICQAFANQVMLAVIGFWILTKSLSLCRFPHWKTFREEFPLPFLLEIFSAYLFFFAIKNSGLAELFLQGSSPFILLALSFLAAQFFSFFMPLPVVFALLFSFFSDTPLFFAAGATIALSLVLNLFFFRQRNSFLFFLMR